MALSVSETDAFWYPIERGGISCHISKGNSISSTMEGGYVDYRESNGRGTYCSTKDIVDVVKDGIEMDELIVKSESAGESAIELNLQNFRIAKYLKEEYEKQNLSF